MVNKSSLAVGMILLPLMAAIAVTFWSRSSERPSRQISTVVVLPAQVFGQTEFNYLADAVAKTLSNHLARIEGLELEQPPLSIEFEDAGADYSKFENLRDVDALVISAITADAGAFQLNVQLFDTREERVVWGMPFQAPATKYLELIRAVGEGLRQVLRPSSPEIRGLAGVSANSDAELAFRRGEHHRDRYNIRQQVSDRDQAEAAFKRALELDPALSSAAAELSRLRETVR
ncbi:MAG: hypothetical protein HY646_11760 [Acidobacteria bacterium]|nr:hypothetical protein [Acidobacteriota bacterium]